MKAVICEFLLGLADHGVTGGASYDALVAATAASHGVDLVTGDRRRRPCTSATGFAFTSCSDRA
jgi:predicted nucleic acid-binding protein